jgi:hypothetical protein
MFVRELGPRLDELPHTRRLPLPHSLRASTHRARIEQASSTHTHRPRTRIDHAAVRASAHTRRSHGPRLGCMVVPARACYVMPCYVMSCWGVWSCLPEHGMSCYGMGCMVVPARAWYVMLWYGVCSRACQSMRPEPSRGKPPSGAEGGTCTKRRMRRLSLRLERRSVAII